MKQTYYLFILLALVVTSCQSNHDAPRNQYYVENNLSFFDPYEVTWSNHNYQGYMYETWIRQPRNLKMVHETFKKIVYKKLFSRFNHTNWCGFSLDVSKPTHELIDSLIITYGEDTIQTKYYLEFWDRRKTEKNDSIVFEILKEVSAIVYKDRTPDLLETYVNDTLLRLVEIREFEDSLTINKALQNFNYLKEIGMHKSAYNLLYERYRYYDIKWNQEKLKRDLRTDTTNCCPQAFVEDNTK